MRRRIVRVIFLFWRELAVGITPSEADFERGRGLSMVHKPMYTPSRLLTLEQPFPIAISMTIDTLR